MSIAVPSAWRVPLPGQPGLWCRGVDESLARQIIERTLDPGDVRLREMTHDLSRFSSTDQLERWRPGRDLVCLQDEAETLLGLVWTAPKQMPARDDYLDPGLPDRGPRLTFAVRTYGPARGHGLAKAFVEFALAILLGGHRKPHSLWYETKAANVAARKLGKSLGFSEASGEAGGTVVGVRIDGDGRS